MLVANRGTAECTVTFVNCHHATTQLFLQEMFEGLKRCEEFIDHPNKSMVSLDEKDLEYLEAAILLHTVGLVMGKKGFHKQSFHIIKVCAFFFLPGT